MTIYAVFTLLLFLLPLAFSPGPGNMFFAANGARFGAKSTIPATLGYHIATLAVTVPLGFGFSSAASFAPEIFTIIKVFGSLYVLWLAYKLLRAGQLKSEEEARPANFLDGAVLLLLNPKAYVIISLMFSQFLNQASTFHDVALISIIFTLNNLAAFTLWTVVGDVLAKAFRTEEHARHLNIFFGSILAIVGGWMLLS